MFLLGAIDTAKWIASYGYWAVLALVALESAGIPLPGETALLSAAAYAGARHTLSLPWVIVAAIIGAVLGDNLGYWIGREGGFRLLRKYGPRVHLDERKIKLGQYLFLRHGGKVVFFGRFVAVLRAWAAFLAGVNRMPWRSFFFYNVAGAIVWASGYGTAAFYLGSSVHRFAGPIGIALAAVAVIAAMVGLLVIRRHSQQLMEEALRALPEPLEQRS